MLNAKEKAVYAAINVIQNDFELGNSVDEFKRLFQEITDTIYDKFIEKAKNEEIPPEVKSPRPDIK